MLRRVVKGVAYSWVGGLFGMTSGLMLGLGSSNEKGAEEIEEEVSDEVKRQRKRDHLVRGVRLIGFVRKMVEAVLLPHFSEGEYKARRELELMGYYPCSKCGIPHLEGGEIDCLPIGAYFSEALGRYVEPEHPDWKKDEYEEATGEKWDETASQKDGSVH